MTINYKGLIDGNHDPVDVVKFLAKNYGGYHGINGYSILFTSTEGFYQITFYENLTEEQKLLSVSERNRVANRRTMCIFTDGCCSDDYADITTEPMTLVTLGHSGDCRKIIDPLVRHFGGYVYDECIAGETCDEWVRLEVAETARQG